MRFQQEIHLRDLARSGGGKLAQGGDPVIFDGAPRVLQVPPQRVRPHITQQARVLPHVAALALDACLQVTLKPRVENIGKGRFIAKKATRGHEIQEDTNGVLPLNGALAP